MSAVIGSCDRALAERRTGAMSETPKIWPSESLTRFLTSHVFSPQNRSAWHGRSAVVDSLLPHET